MKKKFGGEGKITFLWFFIQKYTFNYSFFFSADSEDDLYIFILVLLKHSNLFD